MSKCYIILFCCYIETNSYFKTVLNEVYYLRNDIHSLCNHLRICLTLSMSSLLSLKTNKRKGTEYFY